MSITYIGARIGMFILVVWLATTVIFFLPRIASDRNPVRERLVMMAATGNLATGMEKVVAAYEEEYGLDQPLYLQYIRYLSSLVRGDLNYSLINYPTRVWDMIVQRMPYTLGLVGVSVLTAFALGSLSGATLAWPGAPKWLKGALPVFPDLVTDPLLHVGDHADVSLSRCGISGNQSGGRCYRLPGRPASQRSTTVGTWNAC